MKEREKKKNIRKVNCNRKWNKEKFRVKKIK